MSSLMDDQERRLLSLPSPSIYTILLIRSRDEDAVMKSMSSSCICASCEEKEADDGNGDYDGTDFGGDYDSTDDGDGDYDGTDVDDGDGDYDCTDDGDGDDDGDCAVADSDNDDGNGNCGDDNGDGYSGGNVDVVTADGHCGIAVGDGDLIT